MQAEARAMARAANASVYSPQFLSIKYGSRPIKVGGGILIGLLHLLYLFIYLSIYLFHVNWIQIPWDRISVSS